MIIKFFKKYTIISLIFIASLLLNFFPSNQALADSTTGVLIPLYGYPTNSVSGWNAVYQAKLAHSSVKIVAIINPVNGPGTIKDPNFVFWIQNLQSSGVIVLGYVPTNYAAVSIPSAEAMIDNYKNWYSVNGVMFDEMTNAAGHESYYSTLSTYAKVNDGMTLTVGNPGVKTSLSYIGTVDNLTIYENSGLPSTSLLLSTTSSQDKKNFSIVSYAVNSINQTYIRSASNYVGFMYVTDDSGTNDGNPYNSVSSYLMTLLTYLEYCNPPVSGNWIVTTSCTLAGNPAISGDVTVNPGIVITVPDGALFNVDFKHHHLLIRSGGGVLIKAGGTLR